MNFCCGAAGDENLLPDPRGVGIAEGTHVWAQIVNSVQALYPRLPVWHSDRLPLPAFQRKLNGHVSDWVSVIFLPRLIPF